MHLAVSAQSTPLMRWTVLPGLLIVLGVLAASPQTAEARFTCSNNADCTATANQCDPGQTPCNDGICDPRNPKSDSIGCVLVPNNSKSDDGIFCNGVETCYDRHCHAGTPPYCGDGIGCTDDVCDPVADECRHTQRNSKCSNGLFCDGKEVCDANRGCLPGTPPNCGDGNACTTDRCDEDADRCVNTSDASKCNDGLFCNGVETCNPAGGCNAGTPPNCNDDIACTVDACVEANDTCSHTVDNAACSNGQFCDGVEFCSATLARMTTQVYLGDDVGFVTAEWTPRSGRWVLHQRDFN